MRIVFFITMLLIQFTKQLLAQSPQNVFIGIGAGLDYGGFGIRGEAQPVKNVSIFLGIGYNGLVPAYNGGIALKALTKYRVRPVVMAMYGYNGVIKTYASFLTSKTYYGFTIGGGVELYDNNKKHKLVLAALLPFRQEFDKNYEERSRSTYQFNTANTKRAFSIGLNFNIAKNKKTNN